MGGAGFQPVRIGQKPVPPQTGKETTVGNPASVKRKATEKRRKKYEQRLGPGVYLPKADREAVNAAVEKHLAEKKAAAAARKKK
ncbi:MAG TPA: hypothetical protein VN641_18350 [Urbifossiella sp.]|nr:hypothetical protein [Urbifossiella sp.]